MREQTENIELNTNNCKEYTDAELLAKIEELENNNDSYLIDWENFENDLMTDDEFNSFYSNDVQETEEEKTKRDNEIKKYTVKLTDAQNNLTKWKNKEYKNCDGSVWVGDDLEGGNYSFNYINYKRRENRIKNFTEDVIEYTEYLIELGYKF